MVFWQDGNPTNYIVQPMVDDERALVQLVAIDDDRIYASPTDDTGWVWASPRVKTVRDSFMRVFLDVTS